MFKPTVTIQEEVTVEIIPNVHSDWHCYRSCQDKAGDCIVFSWAYKEEQYGIKSFHIHHPHLVFKA